MQPRVQIAFGTAFDVLLAAASVADPVWRDTFDAGPVTYTHVLSVAGDEFVRHVATFGRFGWINLVGEMAAGPGPWDLDRLLAAVGSAQPEDLHLTMIGGRRRQLRRVVDEAGLRQALRGSHDARGRLATALASQDLVIETTPWLLDATSPEVHESALQLLQIWRDLVLPPEAEAPLAATLRRQADAAAAVLATSSGREYLDAAVGGLRYEPAGLDRVGSVSTTQVAPIVVVVDGLEQTTIIHPPPADWHRSPDSRTRLQELGRAVGDKTRMQLLTLLLEGETTAIELAHGMHAPRTTLLHHLAILRAAGLVHVTVTPGGATVYRLRSAGFAELSAAAGDFVSEA